MIKRTSRRTSFIALTLPALMNANLEPTALRVIDVGLEIVERTSMCERR